MGNIVQYFSARGDLVLLLLAGHQRGVSVGARISGALSCIRNPITKIGSGYVNLEY